MITLPACGQILVIVRQEQRQSRWKWNLSQLVYSSSATPEPWASPRLQFGLAESAPERRSLLLPGKESAFAHLQQYQQETSLNPDSTWTSSDLTQDL